MLNSVGGSGVQGIEPRDTMADASDPKSLNKCINKYELNEMPGLNHIEVSFFMHLLQHQSFDRFNFVFLYVIDQMQLSDLTNLMIIIAQDEEIGFQNQVMLMNNILKNAKTKSLFHSSIEMDKEAFVQRLLDLLDDEDYFETQYMNKQDKKRLQ